MTRAERMEVILRKNLSPEVLEIVDESEAHKGHAGYRQEGETHYRVKLRSTKLNGFGRIACHRQVNRLLASEYESGLHALTLDVAGTK